MPCRPRRWALEESDRPAALPGQRLRMTVERWEELLRDLEGLVGAALNALGDATDPSAVEAELAARAVPERTFGGFEYDVSAGKPWHTTTQKFCAGATFS